MYDASRGFFFYDAASDAGRAALSLRAAQLGPKTRVVEVATDMADKATFFRQLAARLALPDYFGHNFDALEECLRNETVLGARRVVLLHGERVGLPPADFDVYVGVLATAADHWRAAGRPDFLRAAFPVVLEASVRRSVARDQERARAQEIRREELRQHRAKTRS
jgi:RNAse (barnase) inhibitor barstar